MFWTFILRFTNIFKEALVRPARWRIAVPLSFKSHLVLIRLISIKLLSISSGAFWNFNYLHWILLEHIYNITCISISIKPVGFRIANWFNGKVESDLVSFSVICQYINFKLSNLLDMELIFRLSMTNLRSFLSFRFSKINLRSEEFLS